MSGSCSKSIPRKSYASSTAFLTHKLFFCWGWEGREWLYRLKIVLWTERFVNRYTCVPRVLVLKLVEVQLVQTIQLNHFPCVTTQINCPETRNETLPFTAQPPSHAKLLPVPCTVRVSVLLLVFFFFFDSHPPH